MTLSEILQMREDRKNGVILCRTSIDALIEHAAEREKQSEEMTRDAARYRWLTYANWLDEEIMKAHGIREGLSETLDAAIDAAIVATKDQHD